MPLPDERPRASVANLIGRFERTAQRRASSGELATAAQFGSNKDPKSPLKEAPSWLKSKAKIEKDGETVERSRVSAVQSNIVTTPIPVEVKKVDDPLPQPQPTEQIDLSSPIEKPPSPVMTVKASVTPGARLKPSRSSITSPPSAYQPTVDSPPKLKTSKSVSGLKPRTNAPISYKAPNVPILPPLKPQHTGSSIKSTSTLQRAPVSSSSSASAIRRPVPSSTSTTPVRSKTPQTSRPRTPSLRSKTPSALHAPTASSLARSKQPPATTPTNTPSIKKPSTVRSPLGTSEQTKISTPSVQSTTASTSARRPTTSTTPKPTINTKLLSKSSVPKKPLLLSGKATNPSGATSAPVVGGTAVVAIGGTSEESTIDSQMGKVVSSTHPSALPETSPNAASKTPASNSTGISQAQDGLLAVDDVFGAVSESVPQRFSPNRDSVHVVHQDASSSEDLLSSSNITTPAEETTSERASVHMPDLDSSPEIPSPASD